MPESWLLSFDLKLDELLGLKSGISAVSLLMSQDTCRLAGLELMLERSASVSVQPWRVETGHKIHPLQSHLSMRRLIIISRDPSGSHTHRFTVGGWGEPGLASAGSAKLSGHIRGLACDGGTTCGHKAAVKRMKVTLGDAQQHTKTWNVFGYGQPDKDTDEIQAWDIVDMVDSYLLYIL